jgi:Cu+-exporting ATPase
MPVLTFKITGMHCTSCGLLVDDALEDLTGVTTSTTNLRTHTTTVNLSDPSLDPQQIVAAIANLGYTAHPIPN